MLRPSIPGRRFRPVVLLSLAGLLGALLMGTRGLVAPAPAAAANVSVFRMNTGGPAVTDSAGRQWQADRYFTGGGTTTTTHAISGTADQSLFQSERWGMSGYDIPITNGSYTLQLLFAEINPSSGIRVFSVIANGAAILTNHDISATVGDYRSEVVARPVTVIDGQLHLRFSASSNSTTVAGIELLSSASPSGQPMPVGDLAGWHQIFTDDFTTPAALGSFPGSAYGAKWDAYHEGWSDTSGHGRYSPGRTLSATGGTLNIYLHTENGVHLVAAPFPKLPGGAFGQTYGRYTVRFRSDAVAGYKTAWLLWPDTDDWNEGEIDFPEGGLNSTIDAFAHHKGAPQQQDAFSTNARYTSWHTATMEWSPGKVVFILDGATIGTSTTAVPSTPMHWVLQTETCLSSCVPSDSAAGTVQIDWVAVYARA